MPLQVDKAARKDLAAVAKLYAQLFAELAAHQPAYYRAAPGTRAYPQSILDSEDADLLVARQGGRVVGFAHVAQRRAPVYDGIIPLRVGMLVDIAVEKTLRGRGVGTVLVQAARAWAKARGLSHMELHVQAENEAARRLYEKEGFAVAAHTLRCRL